MIVMYSSLHTLGGNIIIVIYSTLQALGGNIIIVNIGRRESNLEDYLTRKYAHRVINARYCC